MRRRERIQSSNDLIWAMVDFDVEPDEGAMRREFEGMQHMAWAEEEVEEDGADEVHPVRRALRGNTFINDECGV